LAEATEAAAAVMGQAFKIDHGTPSGTQGQQQLRIAATASKPSHL
jgi:hypothetical protein